MVDAAPAIFSDAGACTCIFLGRFFCARKQAFYGRIKLDLFNPWYYYATQTLAAHGLEEQQRNFEELLTESVGRVHFSLLIMFVLEY
jgi:hypothetical protein